MSVHMANRGVVTGHATCSWQDGTRGVRGQILVRREWQHNATKAHGPAVAYRACGEEYLFAAFFCSLRQKLNVQAYHGGEGGDESDMEGVNVAICTIEKANSIVNRLAEEKRLEVSVSTRGSGVLILDCCCGVI